MRPTCKNVVLARIVGSMTEFKQIIGRGTRVRDDYGKLWFNIIDYTGSATRLFADPTSTAIRPDHRRGHCRGRRRSRSSPESELAGPRSGQASDRAADHRAADERARGILLRRRAGRDRRAPRLRARPERQAAPRRPLHRLCGREACARCVPTAPSCGSSGPTRSSASEIIEALGRARHQLRRAGRRANQPDADPFDLLCHLAFNAPLRTRRERAQQLNASERKDFFERYRARSARDPRRASGKIRRARRRAVRPAGRAQGAADLGPRPASPKSSSSSAAPSKLRAAVNRPAESALCTPKKHEWHEPRSQPDRRPPPRRSAACSNPRATSCARTRG